MVSALVLLAGSISLLHWGRSIGAGLLRLLEQTLSSVTITEMSHASAMELVTALAFSMATLLIPIFCVGAAIGLAGNWLQTGFVFVPNRLAPSWHSLNPQTGLQKAFSGHNFVSLAISLVKFLVLGCVVTWMIRSQGAAILRLGELSPDLLAGRLFEIVVGSCIWISATLVIVSGLDYVLVWWQTEQSLKMTDQELRDEVRDTQRPDAKKPNTSSRPVSPA